MGSLSTTMIAGVLAVRRGLRKPIGSLALMGQVRGPRGPAGSVPIREAVPLASLDSLIFGGWDILPDDAFLASQKAKVLEKALLDQLRPELEAIRPWRGIFDPRYVRRIKGRHDTTPGGHLASVAKVEKEIGEFREVSQAARIVVLNAASTEAHLQPGDVHGSLKLFEKALAADDERVTPSMIYTYAALRQGAAVVNCTPSHAVDLPALTELALGLRLPLAGRDLKTGQTLLKTILAPGLKARALGVSGWYSTNILGNRDGEVLDDPECLRSKQESKLSVLTSILEPELHPDLYGKLDHLVRIDYYAPRGDEKEAWDSIDIFGWLGYPMQIKINFLCRDSILAAPLALDLALFADLAHRTRLSGPQDWLSLYFKSPMTRGGPPLHDLSVQRQRLEDEIRRIAGWECPEGSPRRGRTSSAAKPGARSLATAR